MEQLLTRPEEAATLEIEEDVCVYCGKVLAKMERNRAFCWECRDKLTEITYDEE
ncbi:hypothetical protein [Bacillus rubiinfantis]|uniref:hypothetical protein n=1 Tax=Bacillus rubiinfantis TaxID=1499680 RepID=UPI000B160271|nr:hypothetical protein [Bacillus rubiinfantis]